MVHTAEGQRGELLAALCRELRADIYLSGPSGREYLDTAYFNGIDVRFHDFRHPSYTQAHGDFVEGLSIIDMLMNEGKRSADILRSIPGR